TASVGGLGDGRLVQLGVFNSSTTDIDGSTAVVSGNSLAATAGGNTATNSVSAEAVNGFGSTVANPSATGGATATATADFAVLNSQSNSGPVVASVSHATMGVQSGGNVSNTPTAA